MVVATGNDRQNRDFLKLIGLAELIDDPRFKTNADRVRNRAAFAPLVAAAMKTQPRKKLLDALEAAHVPAGPINQVGEAFADPQVVARGMRIELPSTGAQGGMVPSVRAPMRIDGANAHAERSAPRLGEHTDAILGELGLSAAEIARLKGKGVAG